MRDEEREQVTVSAAVAPDALVTYVNATFDATERWLRRLSAMALAIVPMEMPQAAYNGARESYKGISVRVIPIYDGTNDISKWRLDLLYGRKLIDPRMVVRFNGS